MFARVYIATPPSLLICFPPKRKHLELDAHNATTGTRGGNGNDERVATLTISSRATSDAGVRCGDVFTDLPLRPDLSTPVETIRLCCEHNTEHRHVHDTSISESPRIHAACWRERLIRQGAEFRDRHPLRTLNRATPGVEYKMQSIAHVLTAAALPYSTRSSMFLGYQTLRKLNNRRRLQKL